MKVVRKKLILGLGVFLLLLPFMSVYGSTTLAISNGPDEIYFEKPTEGEIIANVYQLRWYMRDDQQAYPPFQIDLFSKACAENKPYYGTIADSDPVISGQNGLYNLNWDTKAAIQNKPSVPDDFYCIRICATFVQLKKGRNNYYSLCDKHTIRVANSANQSPKITSSASNLTINLGGIFNYQVAASDPDVQDKLTFELVNSPSFLAIDPTSGLISTVTPITEAGNYTVTVVVKDDRGGSAEQVFTLNVITNNTNKGLEIIEPIKDSVFSKGIVNIRYELSDLTDLEKITIYYSTDAKQWIKVTELPAKEQQGSYEWDVGELETGKYYIKLEAEYTDGTIIVKSSDLFEVVKQDDGSGESVPFISGLKPEAESKITEKRPEIGANYTPSDEAEVDQEQVHLKLDDQELADCQKHSDNIVCIPQQDLELGRHKVSLNIVDTNGKTELKEWFFEVVETLPVEPVPEDQVEILGRRIPRDTLNLAVLIICCGILLLIIPWALFILISNRRRALEIKDKAPQVPSVPEPQGSQPNNNVQEQENYINYWTGENVPAADTITIQPTQPETPEVVMPEAQPVTIPSSEVEVAPKQAEPAAVEVPAPPLTNIEEPTSVAEPELGTQTFGQELEFESAKVEDQQPYATPVPQIEDTATPIQQPSYITDEEIPDWLKDPQADTPMNPGGENVGKTGQQQLNEDMSALPHGDYDLENR